MSVLIPRARTIGVRLSEEEYSALERFCVANGARSISDLARTAISSFVNGATRENALAAAVSAHSAQVNDLEQRLEMLIEEIALLKAGRSSDSAGGPPASGCEPEKELF